MIIEGAGGVELTVRVQPRASVSEVVGVHGDVLKVRVAAPPVDGEANAELVRLLSRRLGVPRSRIRIVRGHGSRRKRVRVEGVTAAEARRALGVGGDG